MSRERDDDRPERPRLSWKEIDQRRDRPGTRREERRPRGAAAEARAKRATKEYVKHLDDLFSTDQGGSEGEALAAAVRDAHGTPQLAEACRAYREAVGIPDDPALLSLFLDARDREIVLDALRALARPAAERSVAAGVRSQLRMLAEDSDDEIAEMAEEVLASL